MSGVLNWASCNSQNLIEIGDFGPKKTGQNGQISREKFSLKAYSYLNTISDNFGFFNWIL